MRPPQRNFLHDQLLRSGLGVQRKPRLLDAATGDLVSGQRRHDVLEQQRQPAPGLLVASRVARRERTAEEHLGAAAGRLPQSEGHGDYGRVDGQPLPELLPRAGKTVLKYDNELRIIGVTDIASRTLTGEPSEALRAAAEDDGAELLVVGARGETDRPRTLGRVANEVSHHAPCDLLIVVPTI